MQEAFKQMDIRSRGTAMKWTYLRRRAAGVACMTMLLIAAGACTPTIKVATDEPITINLNVNIKHEILVKVDKELDSLFEEDSELF
jgi:hypothetical protein